jgi:transcriptional antiterminator RfaH
VLRWYLIHTKPAQEVVAQGNLQRQGYEVYLPRVSQPVQRKGTWRERICPLFPRYLFLRVREGIQSLGPVRSSMGVTGIVRFGFRYGVVPEPVIGELLARTDPVSGLLRLAIRRQLARGAPVQITQGVFGGLEGVFEREDGAERVVVLLNLLGTNAPVQVPVGYLSPGRAV